MAVHAPRTRARRAVHGMSIATARDDDEQPRSASRPARTRATPTSVDADHRQRLRRGQRWRRRSDRRGRDRQRGDPGDERRRPLSADPTPIARPPLSPARSAQPSVATSSRDGRAPARPARSRRGSPASPAGRAGRRPRRRRRPQAAADERRDGRHPRRRRRVQPGVERAAQQVEPGRARRRGARSSSARDLVAVALAPRPRVEAGRAPDLTCSRSRRGGGMSPGWPRATGSGPRVTVDGVDRQDAVGVDLDRVAIHPARRRPVRARRPP